MMNLNMKIGDYDEIDGGCLVVISDNEGQEVDAILAPEAGVIPFMLSRGYAVGVYLGNGLYEAEAI